MHTRLHPTSNGAFLLYTNVMITKRDVHMAMMLRRHCGEGKVVAVVGMAHMEGIEREWEKLDTSSNNDWSS